MNTVFARPQSTRLPQSDNGSSVNAAFSLRTLCLAKNPIRVTRRRLSMGARMVPPFETAERAMGCGRQGSERVPVGPDLGGVDTIAIAAIARSVPNVRPSGRLAPLVAMMKTADPRMAGDLGVASWSRGGRPHRRRALGESEMRSVFVVVRDKLGKESVQVPLVEDDHVVEQIAAHGLDPAFRRTILPRAVRRDLLARMPVCSIMRKTSVPYFLSLSKTR